MELQAAPAGAPLEHARLIPHAAARMSRVHLDILREAPPVIVPSLLLCDFGNLEREVRSVEEAGARCLHLDIMDGVFVPNITYGMTIVSAVRRLTSLPLDVHMMISRPGDFVDAMIEAGADLLTIHAEAVEDPRPLLERIRESDAGAGIAINPGTPLDAIHDCLPYCDMVLPMSVEPGFGAQQFESVALDKLRELKRRVEKTTLLEIDGGVNSSTVCQCAAAGAQMLVVGSAIFRNPESSYRQTIAELTHQAATA
ncbi:MAG: ribulose-phosphate 3-epimerase [Planctomycetota bacterium]